MAGPSIGLWTDTRKRWLPAIILLLLFSSGVLLLAYNNPGFVEKLFGGISIGFAVLSGWLVGVDSGLIPGWFITPGANICEADVQVR